MERRGADLVALHSCWGSAAGHGRRQARRVARGCRRPDRDRAAHGRRGRQPPTSDGSYPLRRHVVPQFERSGSVDATGRGVLSDHSLFAAVTATPRRSAGGHWKSSRETKRRSRARAGRVARAHDRVRASPVPELRAAEHASLLNGASVCGAGESPELDELLGAIIAGDVATDVCARYFSPWFIAHLARCSRRRGVPRRRTSRRRRRKMGSRSASSIAAESHVMTYCASLTTRSNTRHLALGYLPHCADRGAGAAARSSTGAPAAEASARPRARTREDPDVAFAKTLGRWSCAPRRARGCRPRGGPSRRRRRPREGRRAGRRRGSCIARVTSRACALALGSSPRPRRVRGPVGCGVSPREARDGAPGAERRPNERGWRSGDRRWRMAVAIGGAAAAPGRAFSTRSRRFAARSSGSHARGPPRATRRAPSAPSRARRFRRRRGGGGKLVALLGPPPASRLWTEALFHAVPLLEGAHASLTAKEIQLCGEAGQVSNARGWSRRVTCSADRGVDDERDCV